MIAASKQSLTEEHGGAIPLRAPTTASSARQARLQAGEAGNPNREQAILRAQFEQILAAAAAAQKSQNLRRA